MHLFCIFTAIMVKLVKFGVKFVIPNFLLMIMVSLKNNVYYVHTVHILFLIKKTVSFLLYINVSILNALII